MRKTITSRANDIIKDAATYKKPHDGMFLVEGFHTVEMALKAGIVVSIFSVAPIEEGNADLYLVTREIIEKISSTKNPEGIVALCKKRKAQPTSSNRVLLLERVQDPGNVGTLLRTALSFGFKDVILTKGCADCYNNKAILASQGAFFTLNLIEGAESVEYIRLLKQKGYEIIATSLNNAVKAEGYVPSKDKVCLILGNEGQGVEEETIKASDVSLRISMSGIDSLNVGVAGGILMHQLGEHE